MSDISRSRLGLGALGAAVTLYGTWLLFSRGRDHIDILLWLAGGVLVHDVLIALASLAVGLVVMRVAPTLVRGPVAAGLMVLGTVTLAAIPVLGRFGERADNPTLLPRDYTAGWLVFAALVLIAVAVGVVRNLRDARSGA